MTSTRPSILAVTSELPWPLNSGGHLRTFHLLHALTRQFDVRLVAGVTDRELPLVGAVEAAGIRLHPARIRPRGSAITEAPRILAAVLQHEPYVLYRRHDRHAVRSAIHEEMTREPADVLYLDHLDSFLFARHAGASCVALDLHNVYSLLTRRASEEPSRGGLERRYLAREAHLLERIEAAAVKAVDVTFAVSAQEQAFFSAMGGSPVHLIPNGVECGRYASLPTGRLGTPPNVLFIGTLSWAPNIDAVRFLALEVLPKIQEHVAGASLTIVGREPPADVLRLARAPHVTVAGSVPDVLPYLREARLLAVPLETGGGTRLKILEAFAAGLPVVSTPVACEGLAGVNGRDLIISDAAHFADAVSTLLQDPSGGEVLASRARALARDQYDWSIIGDRARQAIESALQSRHRART